MVRQGSVVSLLAALAWAWALAGSATGAPATAEAEPIDLRPYQIEAHLRIDAAARIDAAGREALVADWLALVRRFVGAPWDLSVAEGEGALGSTPLESLDPGELLSLAGERDKLWFLRIEGQGGGFALVGREYDAASRRLGPIHHKAAPIVADLPRALLLFATELFCPVARIGEQAGGGVTIHVRGASIEPASPIGRVVAVGTVFEPLRIVTPPDGKVRVLKIPFSYLRVDEASGPDARCSIVSALRDPLTRRVASKNTLIALGVKPGDRPTALRFVTRNDQAPAAGYVLTARPLPDGPPREVGTTDRQGRIVLEPGFASGLVALRLLAGSVEPMVEFPLMPGESEQERTIPFDPKPATVTLETELESLRDAVIDLVAVRARLEARLKARADGDDWEGVAETLKEFARLPLRESFANRLSKLKDDAASLQARTRTAVLTKTAQAQIADIQALIDRYLDDEIVRSYADAVERARAEASQRARADAVKKSALPPPGVPKPTAPAPKPAPAPEKKTTSPGVPAF